MPLIVNITALWQLGVVLERVVRRLVFTLMYVAAGIVARLSNIAAHHFKNRPALFRAMRDRLGDGGEFCVLNFNYSIRERAGWNSVAKLKRQFAAQIQYNWSVLEFDRGGVDFISPQDIARDLEAAGFAVTVHPCDPLKELWFVRGVKR